MNEDKCAMVVTPVWSTEEKPRLPLLLQNIYWVLNQTHQNKIHVIVDDGSTDQTSELLEKIAFHHPSIKVYHKENGGSSSAVNYGIEQVLKEGIKFDYITIHHSDDLLIPNSLKKRTEIAEKTEASFIFTDLATSNKYFFLPRLQKAPIFHTNEELYHALLDYANINYPTMFWEGSFFMNELKGYDARLTSDEDIEIAIRTLKALKEKNKKFSILNSPSVLYRFHEGNLSYHNIESGTKKINHRIIKEKHPDVNIDKWGPKEEKGIIPGVNNMGRAFGFLFPDEMLRVMKDARDFVFSTMHESYPRPCWELYKFSRDIEKINYQQTLKLT